VAYEMQRVFNDVEFSAKKCRERWCNNINPEVDNSSLNEYEELLLLVYHHQHKNKWVAISKHIPHRNSSKLKNNFSSMIRKVTRKIMLNKSGKDLTFFEYTKIIYLTMLIHDLISTNDSREKITSLAPIHIYGHIKKKRIYCEQCLNYFKKITKDFLIRHKTKKSLQKLLTLNKIDSIRIFLDKLVDEIKSVVLNNKFTEDSLLHIIENLLNNHEILPPIKIESTPKDVHVRCQQPLNQFEIDVPLIPELWDWSITLLRSNLQPSPLLNFPFPSPVFQKSLSAQSQLFSTSSNNLFTPTYYAQISSAGSNQLVKIPSKSFVVPQGVLDGRMYRMGGSDFSSFANQFI
jgi:hypothetical protein